MRNDVTSSNDARIIASYGRIPSSATQTTGADACWFICIDDSENIKLQMSKNGIAYIDPAIDKGNSLESGPTPFLAAFRDNTDVEKFRYGAFDPPHQDSWGHYAWTFDATTGEVKAFVNGVLIDRKEFSSDGVIDTLNTPTDPTARMITFLGGMFDIWQWTSVLPDDQGILTDFFYFNEPITEQEVRYIALNGIAEADTPKASGIVGGYIEGLGQASGLIGGYVRGLDTGSGIIGGWLEGVFQASGLIGGYISGIPTPKASGHIGGYITGLGQASGFPGGYIRGQGAASGLFGGYITGLGQVSGVIGGFINGGLNGVVEFDGYLEVEAFTAQDFDSLVQVSRHTNSDFDAKVEVFQSECPPEVNIVIPTAAVSGLATPFNQYFIGFASGVQGKTIVQTRWSFGDLGGFGAGVESGTNPGYYPVQHRFENQGFYAVKFEAIDSDGMHNSAIRFVHAASGVDPVRIALSGIPQIGEASLTVQYDQNVETLPPGVSITTRLLDLDNGQTTTVTDPLVVYNEPGVYKPVWCVRDSRGITWCDTMEPGIDVDTIQNQSGNP